MPQNQNRDFISPENLLALKNIETLLCTLTKKQEIITNQLREENSKTISESSIKDIEELMVTVEKEKNRLESIKKKMNALHKKSTVLKAEAAKIQQYHEQKLEKAEEERRKEMAMIGQPHTSHSN